MRQMTEKAMRVADGGTTYYLRAIINGRWTTLSKGSGNRGYQYVRSDYNYYSHFYTVHLIGNDGRIYDQNY